MLYMLSVQGNIDKKWDKNWESNWKDRDSQRERLKLIAIAHEHPDLFSASLGNFFFYKDEVKNYGPKSVTYFIFLILWSEYWQISLIIWYRYFSR
jgi:hypothetical protein